MSSTPQNTAAWQVEHNVPSQEVKTAPYTSPSPTQISVRVAAVAVNPVDWLMQTMPIEGLTMFGIKHPYIPGMDVAGTVVEVGSAITRFAVGQRVFGLTVGVESGDSTQSAFQHYTLLEENLTAQMQDDMPFEEAVVLPLTLSTAASAMYLKDYSGLRWPSLTPPVATGGQEVVIVWGGASSVGCNGIQLGKASGYEIVTTASEKNWEFVKKLGANQVFDYKSASVKQDLLDACKGKTVAGVLMAVNSQEAIDICAEVLNASADNTKFIACVNQPEGKELPGGVKSSFVWGSTLRKTDLGMAIYRDYLPEALATGAFVAAPKPLVVGRGLDKIQEAYEAGKTASAQKAVVLL